MCQGAGAGGRILNFKNWSAAILFIGLAMRWCLDFLIEHQKVETTVGTAANCNGI